MPNLWWTWKWNYCSKFHRILVCLFDILNCFNISILNQNHDIFHLLSVHIPIKQTRQSIEICFSMTFDFIPWIQFQVTSTCQNVYFELETSQCALDIFQNILRLGQKKNLAHSFLIELILCCWFFFALTKLLNINETHEEEKNSERKRTKILCNYDT